jgi:CheY-like chemotaxis protein
MWMPIMDGREFIDEYRSAGGATPIIALTGALFATSTQPPPDVAELVSKPFDVDDLLMLVRKYAGDPVRSLVPA